MPKWWATSWITVIRTSSTTSSSSRATRQIGQAEHGDAVRHRQLAPPHAVVVALGERDALVEAEEALLVVVVDEHGHVVHHLPELGGSASRASATSSSNRSGVTGTIGAPRPCAGASAGGWCRRSGTG